jgi:hypothetical protein
MFLRKNKFNEYRLSPLYDEEPVALATRRKKTSVVAAVMRICSTVMLSATDPVCAKSPQRHFVHSKGIGTARKTRQKLSGSFEHPVTFRADNAPSGALSVKRNWSNQRSILGMLGNILITENLLHKIGNAHGYARYCTNSMNIGLADAHIGGYTMGTVRKTITLTDQQDNWVKAQINAGHYTNDSEYIRDLI